MRKLIFLILLLVSCSAWGQNLNGNGTQSMVVPQITSGSYNTNHIMVSQLPGSDMGAKINACLALLGRGGNLICDATDIIGNQTVASTVTCNVANAVILLGPGLVLSSSADPIFDLSAWACSVIANNGETPEYTSIIATGAANDIFRCDGPNCFNNTIASMGMYANVRGNGGARTGGAAIHLHGGSAHVENVEISQTYNGIQIDDHSSCLACTNLKFIHHEIGRAHV